MPRRWSRRVLTAPVLVGLVLALSACGGGGGGGGTKTATNGTIDVNAFDIRFDVKTIIHSPPGNLTVNLHEKGSLPHTFTIAAKNFEIKVDTSKTNASGTVDLPPGNYAFICSTPGHAAAMHGTVEVK